MEYGYRHLARRVYELLSRHMRPTVVKHELRADVGLTLYSIYAYTTTAIRDYSCGTIVIALYTQAAIYVGKVSRVQASKRSPPGLLERSP